MILGLFGINTLFSVSILLDTYNRNQNANKYISKKGYKIKSNNELYSVEKTNNFIHDYLPCFIPVINIFKCLKNISMSNSEYINKRIRYLKSRDMIKFGKYDSYIKKQEILEEKVNNNKKDMTLDDERSYYKNMSDKLHNDYNKLIKLNQLEEAQKLKENINIIDNIYYSILSEMNLDYLKNSNNKSIQRMLRRK